MLANRKSSQYDAMDIEVPIWGKLVPDFHNHLADQILDSSEARTLTSNGRPVAIIGRIAGDVWFCIDEHRSHDHKYSIARFVVRQVAKWKRQCERLSVVVDDAEDERIVRWCGAKPVGSRVHSLAYPERIFQEFQWQQ